jgi:hypothetical protein
MALGSEGNTTMSAIPETIRLRINGLRRKRIINDGDESTSSITLHLNPDTPVRSIASRLEAEYPGELILARK